ncbi:fucosyltransferase 2 [Rhynchospora pubera]|uniref:Fucosyltransferase n=1 Tax=Rhynchospora pubera TaxID=906938 RepID=A0AAV8DF57_9POAL|nr:fucosyltransferase 2 [Rhynchospora pubera]
MDTEVVAAQRKDWRRRITRSPEMVVLGMIIVFFSLMVFLSSIQRSFFLIPFKSSKNTRDSEHRYLDPGKLTNDRFLSGLLSPNFSEQNCLGRYKSSMYRKPSPFPVSTYLIQRLREYEEYHKRCGPNSELYQRSVEQLKSGRNVENSECKYVIWTKSNGLGNRMLSIVSTFLYSLLTKRVILLDLTEEMENLLCEPFPYSTWVLPPDFPIRDFRRFYKDSPESYTKMVENKTISDDVDISPESLPALVYLHAENVNMHLQNHIFCDDDQRILQKLNWMILRSDSYFTAALFLMPMYEKELSQLFPVKESVFHHLGRYILQPANPVWQIIERFYKTYLYNADEKIGIQIRIFPQAPVPFEKMYQRILECSEKEKLFPEVGPPNITNATSNPTKHTAIIVVSLFSEYFEKIKSTYYENSTLTGEMVAVYQPSHEVHQKTHAQFHNYKALAEMYLLSYCDKIVTSAGSTFGYVSHGLAGSMPWIIRPPSWMYPGNGPACIKSLSVEPCLHSPPIIECKGKDNVNDAEMPVPYIKHCEDSDSGLKIFG